MRVYTPDKFTEDKKKALTMEYDKLIAVESKALEYAPLNINWNKADFELKLVDKNTIDIHNYYYQLISSFPNNANDAVGQRWLYNLIETNSDKIVGVLRISNDFLRLSPRDKYLNLDTSVYKKGTQYTLQLKGVIPLPPFNRLAGGKLLAASAFSNEVINTIRKKQEVAGITVCSIYGESIIYDRIPYLKFLGETERGTGVYFGATATNSKEFLHDNNITLNYFDRPIIEIKDWFSKLYNRRLAKVSLAISEDDFMISRKIVVPRHILPLA